MSDNNVSPNLKLQLLGPVADSIAKTLQDCWDLTFGRFSLYVEKHRIRRAKELEDFKETLENKVNRCV